MSVFKMNVIVQCQGLGFFWLPDRRNSVQKLVDPFLRCRRPLNHAGRKPDGAHWKGEHVYIHYKLYNCIDSDVMSSVNKIQTANHDRNEGTQADQQSETWKIYCFHTSKANRIFPVLFTIF